MTTRPVFRVLTDDRGPLVFLMRLALLPLYLVYVVGVTARNALYDTGLLRTAAVDVPVVSVGNLTVGGTGKTPLVIALARKGVEAGRRVAVVARGYGAVADDEGRTDEIVLLSQRVPEADVVMAPDKLWGARRAAERGAEVILVDDGLQHRRLHRDMDIVVVDARAPFGNGSVLPLGNLREPAAGLARADLVVLTHADDLTEDGRAEVAVRLKAFRRDIPVVQATHEPVALRRLAGPERQPPESLRGREVFLFCGIASPDGFHRTVERLGARIVGQKVFPDHHDFQPACLASVRAEAGTAQLLCTEKDATKVARIPGSGDVLVLVIDLILHGEVPPIPGIG